MSFENYKKDKWENLTAKDRQILTSVAINAAASVNQGTHIPVDVLCKYAEWILENFWEFEALQKPSFKDNPTVREASKPKKNDRPIPF